MRSWRGGDFNPAGQVSLSEEKDTRAHSPHVRSQQAGAGREPGRGLLAGPSSPGASQPQTVGDKLLLFKPPSLRCSAWRPGPTEAPHAPKARHGAPQGAGRRAGPADPTLLSQTHARRCGAVAHAQKIATTLLIT